MAKSASIPENGAGNWANELVRVMAAAGMSAYKSGAKFKVHQSKLDRARVDI